MNDISIIAMFCSDVRSEKGGTETLVGVFPDNVTLPNIPGAFTQMSVYVRMHIRPTFHPKQIITRLFMPDGSELEHSEMAMDLVERAREKAIANNASYLGVIARFTVAPMRIAQEGRLQVIVSVDGRDHVAGALNCRLASAPST